MSEKLCTYEGGCLLAVVLSVAMCCLAVSAGGSTSPATATLSPACQQLDHAFSVAKDGSPRASRSLSVRGRARALRVYWDGRAPSRAAAALLAAALRHTARYSRVSLDLAPASPDGDTADICSLATVVHQGCSLLEYDSKPYDNIVISPSMSWINSVSWTKNCLPLEACYESRDAWAPEPRLRVQGAVASAALALLVHVTARAHDSRCAGAFHWTFYKDTANFELCGFTQADNPNLPASIYVLEEHKHVIKQLNDRITAQALHLKLIPLDGDKRPRTKLLELLNERKTSFLFLDYDLWDEKEGVITVTPPPPASDTVPTELEPVVSFGVADDYVLRQVAPYVLKTLQEFAPSPTSLRQILEIEAARPDQGIEDAACSWAINNTEKFAPFQIEFHQEHWVAVFLCANDPDKEEYKKVANITVADDDHDAELELRIELYFVELDCGNEEELNNEYFKTFLSYKWQRLIGVLARGPGLAAAAESAPAVETALVYYDVPEPRARLDQRVRAAAGSVRQLATALAHFLAIFDWSRLALVTESTELAKGLHVELKPNKKLKLHNTILKDNTNATIIETLYDLREKEARIIFVNTNSTIAETILCIANELGMTGSTEYIWILREWRAVRLNCSDGPVNVDHFTISFWWRGGEDSHLEPVKGGSDDTWSDARKKISALWAKSSWPPYAAPLADGLQLLIKNFKQFAKNHPEKFYDLHGHGSTKLLLNSYPQEINGIVQQLQFIDGTIAEPLVFVDRWRSNQHEAMIQLRIKNDSKKPAVQILREVYHGGVPTDGSRFCMIRTGDPFFPHCRDYVLYFAFAFVFIVCFALYLARRLRLKRLARRDALLTAQLLAQREHVASALEDHYVDRAALELYHELGHGCYGRVRYGVLRAPERPPVHVAVKESRDDVSPAEESELLREACTIATLHHDHVVRLIGVCATGGPLLVLMEYAFFGDLREYLCQRRHLAERIPEVPDLDETDEMYHVSARSLTRLAKEAASALQYLADERLVHRDVRASNCLVDVRRSLKLGDFGLARNIGTGQGGEAEYACRRRGLFPVLWMAPESLERGVFTAASDAWALGVLLLELVTLGARPYDAWPPLRVMRYVSAGGRPPLPLDASPDTRRILGQCWRAAPEERLTAGALAALLEESPAALRPALQPVVPPADEDCPVIDCVPSETA